MGECKMVILSRQKVQPLCWPQAAPAPKAQCSSTSNSSPWNRYVQKCLAGGRGCNLTGSLTPDPIGFFMLLTPYLSDSNSYRLSYSF